MKVRVKLNWEFLRSKQAKLRNTVLTDVISNYTCMNCCIWDLLMTNSKQFTCFADYLKVGKITKLGL
jgi:hypothetical protein